MDMRREIADCIYERYDDNDGDELRLETADKIMAMLNSQTASLRTDVMYLQVRLNDRYAEIKMLRSALERIQDELKYDFSNGRLAIDIAKQALKEG